jgi:hypothetical protein
MHVMKTLLLSFVLAAAAMPAFGQERVASPEAAAFVHVVFFWLKNPESGADQDAYQVHPTHL